MTTIDFTTPGPETPEQLYQAFLTLYQSNPTLVEELLNLETSQSAPLERRPLRFIQGIISNKKAYLSTNLIDGKTRMLYQPQRIWTIGRGKGKVAIALADKRLSRVHALIHHVDGQGFFLVDLGSTNGSFVNDEQVNTRVLLKDGDNIRIGKVSFTFLVHSKIQPIAQVDAEILSAVQSVSPDVLLLPATTSIPEPTVQS